MAAVRAKRKLTTETLKKNEPDEVNLFVDAPPDSEKDDRDSTDSESEDSEFSGLEDEDDSSEEVSEVESIKEASTSGEEEDEEGEEEEGESEDEEEENNEADSENETDVNNINGNTRTVKTKDKLNNNTSQTRKVLKKRPSRKQVIKPKGKEEVLDNQSMSTRATAGTSQKDSNDNQDQPTINMPDEYEFDSSDEEDIRNTVGNVPMEWYREFEHIGYDTEGKRIGKPKSGDQLDVFIDKMENPDYWRTVKDKITGQNVVLSDKDVELIQRLNRGKYIDPSYNAYEPWIDFFTHETMMHPLSNRPEHKRSFIPSKWERLKVGRIVHAMKMGWIKPRPPKTEEEEEEKRYYMLWKPEEQLEINKRFQQHIAAPKMALPGHAESYNPPPEYLMTEEEQLAWKNQEPETRRQNFIPQSYSCLRHVPSFKRLVNERFERCLDLYLCPRQRKMRMNVDPEDLIPKLPKPKDLQPFPSAQAILYSGHESLVRSISVDPTGQWLVSGSDDETIKFWEVSTGRCMKTIKMGGVVKRAVWSPNKSFCLVAVAVDETVTMVNPELGDKLIQSNTDSIISSHEPAEDQEEQNSKVGIDWMDFDALEYETGFRLKVTHKKPVTQVSWHARGDYFAVVLADAGSQSVIIHQLSKRRSQTPFQKSKGLVQCVVFHPIRPFLFVATQRYVRVYNLLKQELMKKLVTNCKWVSSIAVHPGGDNLIIGSYDCRLSWFDLDLSTKPYQTLRHHKRAVRQVAYHSSYPLFASASDDGTIIVCHGMVYQDLLLNPLVVPVKVLRGHTVTGNLGVLDCTFHPTQPWLFSCGADNTVRLYT